jgi:hypothetical protein
MIWTLLSSHALFHWAPQKTGEQAMQTTIKQITLKRGELELVKTHDLAVGDLVVCHGEVFRLLERNVSTSHEIRSEEAGACIWFTTAHMGHEAGYPEGVMPAHWTADWTVQGNRFATFARIGDPAAIAAILEPHQ